MIPKAKGSMAMAAMEEKARKSIRRESSRARDDSP
jgi:hypothetical protein